MGIIQTMLTLPSTKNFAYITSTLRGQKYTAYRMGLLGTSAITIHTMYEANILAPQLLDLLSSPPRLVEKREHRIFINICQILHF